MLIFTECIIQTIQDKGSSLNIECTFQNLKIEQSDIVTKRSVIAYLIYNNNYIYLSSKQLQKVMLQQVFCDHTPAAVNTLLVTTSVTNKAANQEDRGVIEVLIL